MIESYIKTWLGFFDLVVSDVEAYKTCWFQHSCVTKVANESRIPPFQNHVFFIDIRPRVLCQKFFCSLNCRKLMILVIFVPECETGGFGCSLFLGFRTKFLRTCFLFLKWDHKSGTFLTTVSRGIKMVIHVALFWFALFGNVISEKSHPFFYTTQEENKWLFWNLEIWKKWSKNSSDKKSHTIVLTITGQNWTLRNHTITRNWKNRAIIMKLT